MQETYWSSAISQLQEKQKHEYKEWVMNVHERDTADFSVQGNTVETRSDRSPSMESYVTPGYDDTMAAQDPLMEESFTIHLGWLKLSFMFSCFLLLSKMESIN